VPVDHGVVTARVRFRTLTEPMIDAYVQTGEGRDKAGGYGVQGLGAALVVEVDGSASTVVGLPMGAVLPALARVGVEPRRQKDAT
jgi:septum formation protein